MPVRVGFVGAGGVANAHMNLLESFGDVQVVGIVDPDEDRAESAALLHLARAYPDTAAMLESEKLDAMYVCVPPFAHGESELLAVRKGIHIFVEKPVAVEMESAFRTRDEVTKSGVINSVGYHWRYQSNTDRARNILEGKTVGMVHGYWMGGMPNVGWWRRMELSGGQMVEQATHIFDLARYLCGEIDEVYAACSTRVHHEEPDFDVYDVGAAALRFVNGAVGTVASTCILNLPYTIGLHLIARDLVVELHGDLKVIEPGHTEVFTARENPMLVQTQAFIEAVKTGDQSGIRSSYEDAVRTLAVTIACNQSAATDQPVKVAYS